MVGKVRKLGWRGALGAGLVAGGMLVTGAGSADAKIFEKEFKAVPCEATLGGLKIPRPTDITIKYDAPEEVFAGATFKVTLPGGETDLPASASGLTIVNFTNIASTHRVVGGTIVAGSAATAGAPTLDGVAIAGGVASHPSPDQITTTLPGPVSPGKLATKDTTFDVVAGAAGTTITINPMGTTLTANIQNLGAAATVCPVPQEVVATIKVVAPPPPGAPDAVADTARTPQDNPVTIDVLANDVPNAAVAIDVSTLGVAVPTKSGALADPIDGKIRYTPPIGFNGTDTFSYRICSAQDANGQPGTCDVAEVTVTVEPPVAVAAPAPAPAPTLPETGSTTLPLAVTGALLVLAGLAALARPRKERFAP